MALCCAKLCLTLCNPMDGSPLDSSIHGVFQARILKWVAISFSRRSSGPRDQNCVSWVFCIGRQIHYHCPHGSMIKHPPASAEDTCSIPDLGRLQLPQSSKHVHHIYSACAVDPGAKTTEACEPVSPCFATEKPPQWEGCTSQIESSPSTL